MQSLFSFNHADDIERQPIKAPLAAAISPLTISPNPPSPQKSETDIYVRTDHQTGNSMSYSTNSVWVLK